MPGGFTAGDPSKIFEQMFGGEDPFAALFGGGGGGGGMPSNVQFGFGGVRVHSMQQLPPPGCSARPWLLQQVSFSTSDASGMVKRNAVVGCPSAFVRSGSHCVLSSPLLAAQMPGGGMGGGGGGAGGMPDIASMFGGMMVSHSIISYFFGRPPSRPLMHQGW
jgi:hypothetical protein